MADETTDLRAELEELRLDLEVARADRDNAVRDWHALLAEVKRTATVKPDLKEVLASERVEYGDAWDARIPEVGWPLGRVIESSILPLLDRWPGRTETEVKAEALREAADRYRKVGESGYLFLEGVPVPWAVVASDLDRLAAELGEEA